MQYAVYHVMCHYVGDLSCGVCVCKMFADPSAFYNWLIPTPQLNSAPQIKLKNTQQQTMMNSEMLDQVACAFERCSGLFWQ